MWCFVFVWECQDQCGSLLDWFRGVIKYSVGTMYNSGQRASYAVWVWHALFLFVSLLIRTDGCSGIGFVL